MHFTDQIFHFADSNAPLIEFLNSEDLNSLNLIRQP